MAAWLPVLLAAVLVAATLAAFGNRRRRPEQFIHRLSPPHGPAEHERTFKGSKERLGSVKGGADADGLSDTAMMLELVASMLHAGAGIGRSLDLISRSSKPAVRNSLRSVVAALAIGADWETAWRVPDEPVPEVARLRDALAFAALTGAPSASILYAQAARERREQFRAAEKRAAALGVKLVVPLGLCSLPAFICLGIVPVLIAMLPAG